MNAYEALETLEYIYDNNAPYMADEQAEDFANALEAIWHFLQKYEPRKELPLEWTCTCGKHMTRHDVYADMSRFFCEDCKAEWLIGPQEI